MKISGKKKQTKRDQAAPVTKVIRKVYVIINMG